MKILIVEDDKDQCLYLQDIIKSQGHKTVVAYDGVEAMECFKREPFDVLVTDWLMPRMNGIELIENVRATITPRPAIIVVTALSSNKERLFSLEKGADGYFSKPFKVNQIIQEIKIWEQIVSFTTV